MTTLEFILDRFKIPADAPSPVHLPLSRWDTFPRLLDDMGCRVGVEVGTEAGFMARALCREIPGLQLSVVDPYKPYQEYEHYYTLARLTASRDNAHRMLAPYGVRFYEQDSQEGVKQFKRGSLDFVFIDGNHEYERVYADIVSWSKRVRSGGIVSGHDYLPGISGFRFGVIEAVDAYIAKNRIAPLFLFTGGDACPSWMWVKP